MGINLFDQQGQFRNFGTVLDEVSGKWSSFVSVDHNAVATAFAGKQKACAWVHSNMYVLRYINNTRRWPYWKRAGDREFQGKTML